MANLGEMNVEDLVRILRERGFEVRGGESMKKCVLDEKHFRRVDKYNGGSTKWNSWLFNFGIAVAQVSKKTWNIIDKVLKVEGLGIYDRLDLGLSLQGEEHVFFDEVKGELYSVLCGLTEGEANTTVRSIFPKRGFIAVLWL